MLIYAKKDFQSQLPKPDNRDDSVINSMPRPSSRALQVVQDLNNAHQIACAAYLEKWVDIIVKESCLTACLVKMPLKLASQSWEEQ